MMAVEVILRALARVLVSVLSAQFCSAQTSRNAETHCSSRHSLAVVHLKMHTKSQSLALSKASIFF